MNIGMLGSGAVAQVVGQKLTALGHLVMLGTRDPGQLGARRGYGASLQHWLDDSAGRGQVGTFAAAAAFGELIVNATNGLASLQALHLAGEDALGDKVLLDLANELDTSQGLPPLSLADDRHSLAEQLQAAFPRVRVVKTLNTMSAGVMVDPLSLAGGDHTVFLSGNDAAAKAEVGALLGSFGWSDRFDLGDLRSARGAEMLLPLWLSAWGVLGTGAFNLKLVR